MIFNNGKVTEVATKAMDDTEHLIEVYKKVAKISSRKASFINAVNEIVKTEENIIIKYKDDVHVDYCTEKLYPLYKKALVEAGKSVITQEEFKEDFKVFANLKYENVLIDDGDTTLVHEEVILSPDMTERVDDALDTLNKVKDNKGENDMPSTTVEEIVKDDKTNGVTKPTKDELVAEYKQDMEKFFTTDEFKDGIKVMGESFSKQCKDMINEAIGTLVDIGVSDDIKNGLVDDIKKIFIDCITNPDQVNLKLLEDFQKKTILAMAEQVIEKEMVRSTPRASKCLRFSEMELI